jgi:hypothetical protein
MHRASASPSRHTSIVKEKKMITHGQPEKEQIKSSKVSHFIAFPRFLISSRRNFSTSAAREALERATLTFAVIVFSSYWEQIRESSLVEGTHLSTAEEELPTVSYEIGQSSDPVDVPCK